MAGKFYVTTPIYYVNDVPHLGHAYTSVLSDIIARYQRLSDKEVFFLTGTDEHGAKVKKAADEKNRDVREFVNENSSRFKELLSVMNVSNSDFIRTSNKERHWGGVLKLWKKLKEKGDIYKGTYKGLYCLGCEAFITEKDLKDGRCIYHNIEPEVIEEENYFFKLSAYGDRLKKAILSEEFKIFPESRKNEALAFLEAGLNDISFSRPSKDIKWGISVPDDASQTIYVWCDALTNYISALGYGNNENNFNKFWPADLHVMAKDIMRFHIIIWSAMLLSADLPLPKGFLIHGFINIGGKKMSKTVGNVIDPFEVVKEYGVDALRYYFSREISPFEDGDFTEERFKAVYNANLANGLGNCASRIFKMILSDLGGKIEKPDDVFLSQVPFKENGYESYSVPYVFERFIWPEYRKHMDLLEIDKAADVAWGAISRLDNFIQHYEPFKLIKTDKERATAVLWSLVNGLAHITWMIYPFIPKTAEALMSGLGVDSFNNGRWDKFSLNPIGTLFPRKE